MSDGGGIVELRGNVGAIAFARLTRVPHSGANCITVLNAFKPISRLLIGLNVTLACFNEAFARL